MRNRTHTHSYTQIWGHSFLVRLFMVVFVETQTSCDTWPHENTHTHHAHVCSWKMNRRPVRCSRWLSTISGSSSSSSCHERGCCSMCCWPHRVTPPGTGRERERCLKGVCDVVEKKLERGTRRKRSVEEDDVKIDRRGEGQTEPTVRAWPAEWVTESWKQIWTLVSRQLRSDGELRWKKQLLIERKTERRRHWQTTRRASRPHDRTGARRSDLWAE